MHWVAKNVARVRAVMAAACTRSGRDPATVTLMAVTKGVPAAHIRIAVETGVRLLGESRIQEALPKMGDVSLASCGDVAWHLIGHLQTNKAKQAATTFAAIHSVDSEKLLQVLERRCAAVLRTLPIFLEVNVSGNATQYGVSVQEAPALATHVQQCAYLQWAGLMAMAPFTDDQARVRSAFRAVRALRDTCAAQLSHTTLQLSMGMSHDFAIAIEEGADIIRVGSAIFQEDFWHGQR